MKRFLTILFLALPLAAQSPVIRQGTTPTGTVDFSGAATTKPLRIGTTLPGTCTCLLYTSIARAGRPFSACRRLSSTHMRAGARRSRREGVGPERITRIFN